MRPGLFCALSRVASPSPVALAPCWLSVAAGVSALPSRGTLAGVRSRGGGAVSGRLYQIYEWRSGEKMPSCWRIRGPGECDDSDGRNGRSSDKAFESLFPEEVYVLNVIGNRDDVVTSPEDVVQ